MPTSAGGVREVQEISEAQRERLVIVRGSRADSLAAGHDDDGGGGVVSLGIVISETNAAHTL
jgi:hypothetical protein